MRDEKQLTPSSENERDVWKELGSRTLVVTLIGYVTLISYTWPQGFIPLVSIQSLPILLLGFVLLLIIVLIVLGIFFLPFWFYTDKRLVEAIVCGKKNNSFEKSIVEMPVRELRKKISDIAKLAKASVVIFKLIFPLPFCFAAWYLLSSGLEDKKWLLPLPFAMLLGFVALTGAMKAKSLKEANPYLFLIGIVFLLLPSCFFSTIDDKAKPQIIPNPLVRDALRITSLGGEIPIQVIDPHNKPLFGYLLFNDGTTVWLKHCNDKKVLRVQIQAAFVTFPAGDMCKK